MYMQVNTYCLRHRHRQGMPQQLHIGSQICSRTLAARNLRLVSRSRPSQLSRTRYTHSLPMNVQGGAPLCYQQSKRTKKTGSGVSLRAPVGIPERLGTTKAPSATLFAPRPRPSRRASPARRPIEHVVHQPPIGSLGRFGAPGRSPPIVTPLNQKLPPPFPPSDVSRDNKPGSNPTT